MPFSKISPMEIQYSIIVPLFNESENVRGLLAEIRDVMAGIGGAWEAILIDDGSSDRTGEILLEQSADRSEYRVFSFKKNQGQASALYFGMGQARAPILIIMDGDGQNDPKDIPRLLDYLDESGADMAIGVRTERRDSVLRRYMSRTANAIRSRILGDGVSDTGCAIKVLKRRVADSFIPLRTLYSFMPALAVAAGHRVVELGVNHRLRLKGRSNYGLGVMFWRPLVDMLGIWWFIQRRCETGNLAAAPLQQEKADRRTAPLASWKNLLLLGLLVSAFFIFLGSRGLNEPDEGRYAELGREMAVSGDWLTPRLNGFEHFQKPPLLYWTTALSFKTFGFNEWAARLPSTVAALGILAMTGWMASLLFGRAAAIPAVLILASSFLFFSLARFLTPDMLMTFFIVAALACLIQATHGESPGSFWRWGFFIAMGLGFLTKGPMALVVPVSGALALQFGLRRNSSLFPLPWVRGLLLALVLGLSWFCMMVALYPRLADYFLGYELVKRFGSHAHGRSQPFWFFVPVLVIGFMPWFLFVPGMARSLWKRVRSKNPLTPAQWLLLGWVVPPFLILSASGSKLLTYILPLLPAFALATAYVWQKKQYSHPTLVKLSFGSLCLLILVFSQADRLNDSLGRQASVKTLVQRIQELSPGPSSTIFAAGVRTHGLEFYLKELVSVSRPDADLVLPVSPQQNKRLFASVLDAEKSMAARKDTYGIVRHEDFAEFFQHSGWEILANAGDFVLIRPVENKL